METQNKEHPSALHLAALALGKLKPDAAAKVQSHLSDCGECQSYISHTPRDELAEIVRQARHKAAEQNTLATGLSGTIGLQTSPGLSPRDAVPPVPPGSPSSGAPSSVQHEVGENEIPHDLFAQSKYRIVRVLGRGGMGTVYQAEHVRMKRPVAIKVINPELVNHPQALSRFEKEIEAVASLDHTNIARAFDAENIGSLQVFVMEFVRGQTLYDFLKSRGRLSAVDACRCVRQALIGLQHAHQHGLVHRDLKPQNLMLTRDTGQIKILDFGLAKAVSENRQSRGLTSSQATMGTYAYMAPEQALDAASADIRADIYSLGCTLYYLIGGVLPFDYETDAKLLLAHQNEVPCLLHEFRTEVPEALSALVARMLAKNPADRPQTPKEAADALLPFARGDVNLSPAMFADPLARPIAKRSNFDRWKWGGIAAALLFLVVFGVWAAGLFVRTPYGTIVVENAPADADVSIDGNSVTFTRNGESLVIESVERGSHHLKLLQGGREIQANDVKIKVGGQLVTVTFTPKAQQSAAGPTPKMLPSAEPPPTAKLTLPAPKSLVPDKLESLAATPSRPSGDKATPSPQLKTADGFVPLFNGKDLTGWTVDGDDPKSWTVEDGVLLGHGGADYRTRNYLLTDRDYADFILRLEFNLEAGSSTAVAVRAIPGERFPFNGRPFFDHPIFKLIEQRPTKEQTGTTHWIMMPGAYVPPNHPAVLQPAGSWNNLEMEVRGNHIRALVNGAEVLGKSTAPGDKLSDGTIPGLSREKGRIGFQKHTGLVRFRNVEIKELPPTSDATSDRPPREQTASASGTALTVRGVTFPAGAISFADEVVSFVRGADTRFHQSDTKAVLGSPDAWDKKFISLGQGGTLIVKFNDNALVSSGNSDPDLCIFEGGVTTEPMRIAISSNGTDWIDLGRFARAKEAEWFVKIDIDRAPALRPAYPTGTSKSWM